MKTLLPLLGLCGLFLFWISPLQAQDDRIEQELALIRALDIPTLIWEIDTDSTSRSFWLQHERLRHEVIRKLEHSFELSYELWFSKGATMKYLKATPTTDTSANDIKYVENLVKTTQMSKEPTAQDFSLKNWLEHREELFFNRWNILFAFLQFDRNIYEEAIITANVSVLKSHHTLQYLSQEYNTRIKTPEYEAVAPFIKDRNFRLIQDRLALVENERFVHYKSNESFTRALKEVDLYMDNDVLVPPFNQDRDYTGGGALTFTTDYFAWRWLNTGWLTDFSKNRSSGLEKHKPIMMAYQSLSIGMQFYTPYIRYRNNFALADTLFQHDRPFGSYVYVDRSKYRIWPKGFVRHRGSLQVGRIGTNWGRDIQATLHKDAVVESQKVYGWDRQIGQGGRWLVQVNHTMDVLLYSQSNRYRSVFKPYDSPKRERKSGLNIIATADLRYGGFLSAAGGGLRVANRDFTTLSGGNMLKPRKNNTYRLGLYAYAEVSYRYIIHNSMLEGFGYRTTFTDDLYDDEAVSVYTLNEAFYKSQNEQGLDGERRYPRTPAKFDQLNRNLLFYKAGLGLRSRQMSVYFNISIHTREFKDSTLDLQALESLVAPEDIDFYRGQVVDELTTYRNRKFYACGQIGVAWLVAK